MTARAPGLLLVLALVLELAGCSDDQPAKNHDAASASGSGAGGAGTGGGGGAPGARANGTVGPWQALAAMPEPRANHCSVVAAGWLLVFGGNYKPRGSADFVKTDLVHAARVEPDGTLGAWQAAGKTPSPVTECTVAVHGSSVLLVDGIYDVDSDGSQVWSAELTDGGMLGAWTSLGALPPGQRMLSSEAETNDATLFVMATELPDAGDAVLTYRADVSNGLGAWSSDAWLPGFRGQPMYAFTAGYVYAIGGYLGATQGNEVVARVDGAPRGRGGAIGKTFPTEAMPAPLSFGEAIAVDEYLFVVGGKKAILDGTGQPTVTSSKVVSDGHVAPWTAQTPLPEGRTNHDMVLGGDFLYVTGGGSDGLGLDTVFSAQVRF